MTNKNKRNGYLQCITMKQMRTGRMGEEFGQLLKFHCISVVHFGVNNQDLTCQKSLI